MSATCGKSGSEIGNNSRVSKTGNGFCTGRFCSRLGSSTCNGPYLQSGNGDDVVLRINAGAFFYALTFRFVTSLY